MGSSPTFTNEETEAQRSNSLTCDFVPGLSAKELLFGTTAGGSGSPCPLYCPTASPITQNRNGGQGARASPPRHRFLPGPGNDTCRFPRKPQARQGVGGGGSVPERGKKGQWGPPDRAGTHQMGQRVEPGPLTDGVGSRRWPRGPCHFREHQPSGGLCAWGTGSLPCPAYRPTAISPPPPGQHPWDFLGTGLAMDG